MSTAAALELPMHDFELQALERATHPAMGASRFSEKVWVGVLRREQTAHLFDATVTTSHCDERHVALKRHGRDFGQRQWQQLCLRERLPSGLAGNAIQ